MTDFIIGIERSTLIREAFRLEWITVGFVATEVVVAIAAGVAAHSLTLVAFGTDSVIELLSACVLLWRLNAELRHGPALPAHVEHRAHRIGGALLFALAVWIVSGAVWNLWHRHGQEFSLPGLTISMAAMPAMFWLAKAKLRIGKRVDSRALRADAAESVVCGYLSAVVIVNLIAQLLVGAWWVDSVSALILVPFIAKEAWEAWGSEDCCADASRPR